MNSHILAWVWERHVSDIFCKTALFWDVMRYSSVDVYMNVSEEPADSVFRVGQLSGNDYEFPDNWGRADVRNVAVPFRFGVADSSRGLKNYMIILKVFHWNFNILALYAYEMLERGYAHTSYLKYRMSVISYPWKWQLSREHHLHRQPTVAWNLRSDFLVRFSLRNFM